VGLKRRRAFRNQHFDQEKDEVEASLRGLALLGPTDVKISATDVGFTIAWLKD